MKFLFQIINGLHIGSIYALVALGYSMVYGIVKLINFAHGDIIMVGAYAAYVLLVLCGLPVWVAVIGSIVFCALAGVLIERIAYRRLLVKEAPRISLLITAIGVSIFLQNLFQLIFTSSGKYHHCHDRGADGAASASGQKNPSGQGDARRFGRRRRG